MSKPPDEPPTEITLSEEQLQGLLSQKILQDQQGREYIDVLLREAHEGIAANVQRAYALDPPVDPGTAVILVLTGDSPLAVLAHQSLRDQGSKGVAVALLHRNALTRLQPELAQRFEEKDGECAHLKCLVSSQLYGAIKCATCDLKIAPTVS